MQKQPDISLILPLYNAEKYLRPCLDSVLNQTFQNFECLCINDGATDNTASIVAEYSKRDKRIKTINQKNQGCSEARNTGIRRACAPYLTFLDQDDLFHPQALETLFYLIETYQTDIASFTYQSIDDSFNITSGAPRYDLQSLSTQLSQSPLRDFYHKTGENSVVIWTRIYNKSKLGKIFFPKNVQPAEDTVYTIKTLFYAKSLVQVQEPLLFYRGGNSTSVMSQGITKNYIQAHHKAALDLMEFISENVDGFGDLALRAKTDISKFLYKSCIARPLSEQNSKDQLELLRTAHPLVLNAKTKKAFHPCLLNIKRQLVTWLFLKRQYNLARLLR